MGRISPSLCVFGLLWIAVAYTAEKNHHQFSPFRSTKQEFPIELRPKMRDSEFVQHTQHLVPPHLFLPMFRHAAAPFVNKEHFRPVAGRRTFQSTLTNILVPQGHPQHIQVAPVDNKHGVEVWCGYRKVSVRINTARIGVKGADSDFYLGTCPVSRSVGHYLYFYYDLNDCGSSLKVRRSRYCCLNNDSGRELQSVSVLSECVSPQTVGGHVVYSNSVEFRPAGPEDEEEEVIRVMPLTLPIQCLYNRFHYSYKVGYVPHAPWMFRRTLSAKRRFTMSVCNEKWEILTVNEGVVLGEPLYFEAAADVLAEDETIFISSCHMTASKDPNSTPRHDLISNSGCLVDSRRTGSRSRFVLRQSNVLRFSSDTFLFPHITSRLLYLHCTIFLGRDAVSPTAKSCTYNKAIRRWEELHSDDSVCACCDSVCEAVDFGSLAGVEQAVVTSQPWSFNTRDHLPGNTWGRPNTLKGNVQVKFLQKHTEEQEEEEEVFQGGVEESLSPAEVDDENTVQQVLTWSGLNISPVRKEEESNIQVKFLQKHTEEEKEEVFQGGVEESLSPAEVDDENTVQQVLTWPGLNISPVRKEEEVKFLQKDAEEQEEEVFQGGVEESLSPTEVDVEHAEVDDERAVQQVLTWSGLNTSPVRKEEEEEEVSKAPAWNEWLPAEEKREEGMMRSVPGTVRKKEMGRFRKLSQKNWNHVSGKASSIAATEKPEGVEASTSAEDTDEPELIEEDTFLRAQHEPAEWSEDHQ
ncbi:zona pellucida glycoprotein 3d tandem duplicate 1 [Colossoma macropomum]|uniref:zona pellucida glycoprotein 3d tandem duplicate 1 n=1 Tax=Colossoma macropomum TaxID=42526 RepID=UPI0018656B86|nr:zona pellucida glycoprotein 3d tandem duplicate 1 [Colossoma macropomum]